MRLEPALLSYAGLTCLALSTYRVRRDIGIEGLPAVTTLRGVAVALLLLAAWSAVRHFGPDQGPVAYIGMVSAAGLPLVLLISRWPRLGLLTGIGASVLAFGMLLLSPAK